MEEHRSIHRPTPTPTPTPTQGAAPTTIGSRVFFYPTRLNPINYSILRLGEPLTALVVFVHDDGTVNLVVVDHLGRAWFEERVHFHRKGVRREGERHCMAEYEKPPTAETLPTGGTPTPLPTPAPVPLTARQHEMELEKQLEEEKELEHKLAREYEAERQLERKTEEELKLWREREERQLRRDLENLRLRRMRNYS
jgi:hypothetical protein